MLLISVQAEKILFMSTKLDIKKATLVAFKIIQ